MRNMCVLLLLMAAGCQGTMHEELGSLVLSDTPQKTSPSAEAFNHYIAATIYEKRGQLDAAIEEMQKASELAPDSPTLCVRLIRAYLHKQDYENARIMAEKAVDQRPENANLWIVLGEIYHLQGRSEDAVQAFKKAIAADPKNILGYGALVSLEESVNDLVAAVDIYKKLAELTPSAPGVHFQLGLCLARMNDAEGAKAALQQALKLNPELVRAVYLLGIICLDLGQHDQAIDYLSQYLAKVPEDVQARENLAGAFARKEQYPQAIAALLPIFQNRKAKSSHHIEIVYLLLRTKQYKEAEDMLPPDDLPFLGSILRAFARKGIGKPHLPLINTLDAIEGNLDEECSDVLNEFLHLFGPEKTGAYFISMLEDIRGQGVYSKTIEIVLARTLMSLERDAEAEVILSDLLKRFKNDKYIHYYLAVVYDNLKRVPETERHLKAYLELEPNDPDILNFLGYFYAVNNMKLDEAEALLNRALKLDPNNAFFLDSLGWIYYRKGNADRAIELIRKAILVMENDDVELRDHLGDAYLLKGDVEKAVAEWERAYRLNPEQEGVKEKLDKYRKDK